MIETLLFFVTITTCAIVITATLIGVTLLDVILIRQKQLYAKHPHARRWRHRPFISLIGTAKQHLGYRKIEYIEADQQPKGELVAYTVSSIYLNKEILNQLIWEFNARPNLAQITLSPRISDPKTFIQLIKNYFYIATDVFRRSRAGLGIYQTKPTQPVIQRVDTLQTQWQTYWHGLYQFVAAMNAILIPIAVTYIVYIALSTKQPDMLTIVLCSFGIFMAASIWGHEAMTFKQKVFYSLLLPVTPIIFYFASLTRLLKVLANVVKAIFHRRIGLFVRVKNVLRVVE
jgi:hypothetical protein